MPITKHNFLVRSGGDIPRVLAEAFHIAASRPSGAVQCDIPKDVLRAGAFAGRRVGLPGYKPNAKPAGPQATPS